MPTFLKMHGLGNDFVIFDGRVFPVPVDAAAAKAIADRRRGIGCDQVIVMERAAGGAGAFMRIFNADGGEVESCGNAARCVAHLLMAERESSEIAIDTLGGPLFCRDAGQGAVTVDMGSPRLDWREIPMSQAVDTASFALSLRGQDLAALGSAMAVSVGNPHCILFVEDVERAPVATLGPLIEHHPWFPARTNVEFVEPQGNGILRLRVWERGAGITQACGTGACAALVAAVLRGVVGRSAQVLLDGGALAIEWRESDGHVLMTGPVSFSFAGEVDLLSRVART